MSYTQLLILCAASLCAVLIPLFFALRQLRHGDFIPGHVYVVLTEDGHFIGAFTTKSRASRVSRSTPGLHFIEEPLDRIELSALE